MNDDAIIKVGFDVDFSNFEQQIKELQNQIDNADISKGVDTKLLNSVRQLNAEVNKFVNSLKDADRNTEGITKLQSDMERLQTSTRAVRDAMVQVSQEQGSFLKSSVSQAAYNTEEQRRQVELGREAVLQSIDAYEQLHQTQRETAREVLTAEQNTQREVQQTTQEKLEGEQEVQKVRTSNETKAHTQGLINIRKKRSLIISGIKEFYNNTVKYTKMWMSLLGSAFAKVGSGFKNLLGNIFSKTGSQASSLFSNLKGLLGIAGGVGLYKLGSEAIKTSNDFKTMGNTSAVVARQMSNAFYEAAGDSYNSLVKLSNGTTQVTTTLKKFINTWTGQIALMKAQLTAIGSNIGNLLVKVFYPLLVVLNRILAVVNLLVGKLASLFGFNTANLKGILGDLGGQGKNNKGMEDYAKATDKAAKSTKKLKDETKKAKENLQGYDKLNNTTTDDLDALSDTLDDLSDLGGIGAEGLIDTDALFDNLMQDLDLIPEWLRNWIDELIDLIKAGDWTGVGSKIGQLVNRGLYALNDFLSDTNLLKKIHNFNSALLDFVNGLVGTVNWKVLGTDIAKGLNTITFAIDDLYTQAVQKGTLNKIGKALAYTFKGFLNNFDAEQAGRAAVSAARAMIDIVYSALSNINDDDINKIAEGIHGLVKGAFNRLLGLIDGEDITGAQKIGESIAKIINIGLETVGSLVNKDTATSAADAIIEVLNSAIEGLDEDRMKKALSGMLQFIGTFFSKLATEINTDEFIDKLTNTINNSIANGDVESAVEGFTRFINNVIQALKKIIVKLDWKGLISAVKEGFVAGGGEQILKDWLTFVVAPSLVLALAHGLAKAAEWAMIGKILGIKGGSAISGAIAAGGKGLFALKNLSGITGGLSAVMGFLDSVNNGLNETNATATILGATLMGLSMGGPIGGVIGALLAGLAELGVAYEQNTDGFRDWVEDKKQQLSLLWPTITDGIIAFINNSKIEFTNFWNENAQGFETWKTTIGQKVDDIINSITTTFNNFVQDAFDLGENVVKGIADGISSGIGWVRDKVDSIVNEIESRFSSGLKIFSPSRVMRDLAIYVPEGVALGIEDGESDVTSAMDNLVDSIKFSDFYSEALQETDVFVSDVTDKLAGIEAPTLDPLQYQSKILSSPAAATRALSQSYADTAGQRTDGVLSGIYNRMINAGQASGRNVIVDVYLDKNNRLGQYVIDTMKGQVVMTGGV